MDSFVIKEGKLQNISFDGKNSLRLVAINFFEKVCY